MVEELTRKLLKVFGMAVTDFEDRCREAAQQARDEVGRGVDPAAFLPVLEGLVRSTLDVTRRWMEVTQLIVEQQHRTCTEVLGLLDELKKRKGLST
jgi:hypothetical protein